ncbi:MAG: nucleotidyltransferase family protein, partial [Acholeplasmataceae bacterium]|nr:nucleotidyltransferase family protein [Acholeplasmataceae bacterium]
MDNRIDQLLEVVKYGLNQKAYHEPIIDDRVFYVMAVENGLCGIVYSALDQKVVSKQLHQKLEHSFYGYVSRDAKQIKAIEEIDQILNENKIDHIFLKGSKLKKLYPESYMRAMGDIDLLIKDHDLEKTHQVLKEHQIKNISRSRQHDIFEFPNKIIFEVHPILYKAFNDKYSNLFENPWEYSIKVHQHLYKFTHEFEMAYLTYHLAKHMDSSGIGIRSILDLGIYLNAYEKDIDEALLDQYLEQSNMKLFYKSMIELNRRYFDFNYNYSLHQQQVLDENTFREMTLYLIQSGIHGTGKDFNAFTSRI